MKRSYARIGASIGLMALIAGCGGSGQYAARKDEAPRSGPANRYDPDAEGLFGEGGLTLGKIASGNIFGNNNPTEEGTGAPVNRYLWQAALDTVSFMPLASTDPYTGVIATDWSSSPAAPDERYKVTVYLTSAQLSAASVKVAVYRQQRNAAGTWIQAAVDPATPRQIEDAIMTRARQIRIAALEAEE